MFRPALAIIRPLSLSSTQIQIFNFLTVGIRRVLQYCGVLFICTIKINLKPYTVIRFKTVCLHAVKTIHCDPLKLRVYMPLKLYTVIRFKTVCLHAVITIHCDPLKLCVYMPLKLYTVIC
jgi:accessory gene regulator protein AgrB